MNYEMKKVYATIPIEIYQKFGEYKLFVGFDQMVVDAMIDKIKEFRNHKINSTD